MFRVWSFCAPWLHLFQAGWMFWAMFLALGQFPTLMPVVLLKLGQGRYISLLVVASAKAVSAPSAPPLLSMNPCWFRMVASFLIVCSMCCGVWRLPIPV